MNVFTVWLLIAVSNGGYNTGTALTLSQHPTKADCFDVVNQLYANARSTKFFCAEARIAK